MISSITLLLARLATPDSAAPTDENSGEKATRKKAKPALLATFDLFLPTRLDGLRRFNILLLYFANIFCSPKGEVDFQVSVFVKLLNYLYSMISTFHEWQYNPLPDSIV